jgi:hypothetical protein
VGGLSAAAYAPRLAWRRLSRPQAPRRGRLGEALAPMAQAHRSHACGRAGPATLTCAFCPRAGSCWRRWMKRQLSARSTLCRAASCWAGEGADPPRPARSLQSPESLNRSVGPAASPAALPALGDRLGRARRPGPVGERGKQALLSLGPRGWAAAVCPRCEQLAQRRVRHTPGKESLCRSAGRRGRSRQQLPFLAQRHVG